MGYDTQRVGFIQGELNAISRGDYRSWVEISSLLQAVDETGYWQKESAVSFTEWMNNQSPRFGVKQATLWRYLGAGKSYRELFEIMASSGEIPPDFASLPVSVSPESIEILSKLSRVVPENMLVNSFQGVLTGTLKRVELRARWESFRVLLDGRTARGRNVEAPKVDLRQNRSRAAVLASNILDTLRNGPNDWTGIKQIEKYAVFPKVMAHFSDTPPLKIEFDAVAFIKPAGETAQYHALEIRGNSRIDYFREINRYLPYFDFFWYVFPEPGNIPLLGGIPEVAGVLKTVNATLAVVRQAQRIKHKEDRRIELASTLLLRSLKK